MVVKRGAEELPLKSIWDEALLQKCGDVKAKHTHKLWRYIMPRTNDPNFTLDDVPISDSLLSIPFSVERYIRKSGFRLFTTKIVDRIESVKDNTTKLLVELQDGHRIESVIIRHRHYATLCVSSQIGCAMGCKFCATGTMGILGDLTAGEILEQFVLANNITKLRNVVFMGMGEPLNNFENVKRAIQFLTHPERYALSPRHVTVSTVGVRDNMFRLTHELPMVNLALSLHAPDQATRLRIIPTAGGNKIDGLMEAVDNHIQNATARRRGTRHLNVMYELNSKDLL